MRLTVSRRVGIWLFLALAVLVGVAALVTPRIDLPPSYHDFADRRSWLGVPNFGDVASNLAFFIMGFWGMAFLPGKSRSEQFVDSRERWPYLVVFLGLLLTAFGSAYYHWAPDNARLVWDRLPMAIVFMPLVAALIAERLNWKLGLWLLPILTAVGIASVIQWHWTVRQGAGDLRFYGAVQVYAVLALGVALLLPPRYTRGSDFLVVAGLYAIAKICELADRQIFSIGHLVSGHTLKHLAAGLAGFWILRMLQKRTTITAH
jgi:hypothetical protein